MARSNRYRKYILHGTERDPSLTPYDWFATPIGLMHPSAASNTPLTDTAVIQATDMFMRDVMICYNIRVQSADVPVGLWAQVFGFVDDSSINDVSRTDIQTALPQSALEYQAWAEGEPRAIRSDGVMTLVRHKCVEGRFIYGGLVNDTMEQFAVKSRMKNVNLKEGRMLFSAVAPLNAAVPATLDAGYSWFLETNYQRRPRHRR